MCLQRCFAQWCRCSMISFPVPRTSSASSVWTSTVQRWRPASTVQTLLSKRLPLPSYSLVWKLLTKRLWARTHWHLFLGPTQRMGSKKQYLGRCQITVRPLLFFLKMIMILTKEWWLREDSMTQLLPLAPQRSRIILSSRSTEVTTLMRTLPLSCLIWLRWQVPRPRSWLIHWKMPPHWLPRKLR